MPIIRHAQERNFTALPNSLLQDKRLHLNDVGLLCFMLSLPSDWKFSERGLAAILPYDGVAAIGKSLQRIEAAGYLKRKQDRGKDGKLLPVVWYVSDEPHIDFAVTEIADTAKPLPGNRAQSKITSKQDYKDQKKHDKKEGDVFARTDRICGASSSECSDGDAWDALYR